MLEDYEKEGLINAEEKKMFKNIASFGDKRVATIMTPRADIIAIKQEADLEEVKKIITTNGHTRIPVFKENFDEMYASILNSSFQNNDSHSKICSKLRQFFNDIGSRLLKIRLKM